MGHFLQEELTRQLVLNRKFATQSADLMQIWHHELQMENTGVLSAQHMPQIGLSYLLSGKLHKVVRHASFTGEIHWFDAQKQFRRKTFRSTFQWKTPDSVVQALLDKLSEIHPDFSSIPISAQGYTWEALELFYLWKQQGRVALNSAEWQQQKSELETLQAYYPEIAPLVYPELAAMLLVEGSQAPVNSDLLKKAKTFVEEALRLEPNSDRNHALMAQILYAQNDKLSAKSQSVIASGHNPQNPIAQIIYGLTIGLSQVEGERFIKKGLSNNPFLADYSTTLDRNFFSHQAIRPLLQSSAPEPELPEAQGSYATTLEEGKVLFRQKAWPEAQAAFDKALSLDPTQLEPELYLARILLAQNQYEAAIDALQILQSLFPESAQVFLYLGLAHERLQAFPEAEQHYRKALFFNPTHPLALLRLSTVLIKGKNFQEAFVFLETLTRRYPDYSAGWWNLSILQSYLKDWQKAEIAVKQALRLEPNNSKFQDFYKKIQQKTKP